MVKPLCSFTVFQVALRDVGFSWPKIQKLKLNSISSSQYAYKTYLKNNSFETRKLKTPKSEKKFSCRCFQRAVLRKSNASRIAAKNSICRRKASAFVQNGVSKCSQSVSCCQNVFTDETGVRISSLQRRNCFEFFEEMERDLLKKHKKS